MKKTQKKPLFSAKRIIDTMRDDVNMKKEIRKMKRDERNPAKPEDKGSIGNVAKAAVAMLILFFALSAQAALTPKEEWEHELLKACISQAQKNLNTVKFVCETTAASHNGDKDVLRRCTARGEEIADKKYNDCTRNLSK